MARGLERPPRWALIVITVTALALGSLALWGPDHTPPKLQAATRDRPVTAVFLGDSYTEGAGSTQPHNRWTSLTAQAMGWTEVNRGQGGTGFVNPSSIDGRSPYPERIAEIVALHPDVVVVAGGQNDLAADPSLVAAAVRRTYAALRGGLPDAKIVAVGPSTPTTSPGAAVKALDAAVQQAAGSVQATYISLIDPNLFDAEGLLADDLVHPNDAGHKAIADRVTAALRAAGQ